MTWQKTLAAWSGTWLIFGISLLIIGGLIFFWDPAALLKVGCWFDPLLLGFNAAFAI